MAKKKTNTKVKNDVNFVQSNIENTPTECSAVTSEVIKTEVLTGNINVGSIRTPEDVTGSTIDLKVEGKILSTFNKFTFENKTAIETLKKGLTSDELSDILAFNIKSDYNSKIKYLNFSD